MGTSMDCCSCAGACLAGGEQGMDVSCGCGWISHSGGVVTEQAAHNLELHPGNGVWNDQLPASYGCSLRTHTLRDDPGPEAWDTGGQLRRRRRHAGRDPGASVVRGCRQQSFEEGRAGGR